MSNFTKSILYSGFVLAIGLIAIFAISTGMSPEGSQFSAIEPAAGTSMGTIPEGTAEGFISFQEISDMATDAAKATGEIASEATTTATEMATDAMTKTDSATAHKTMEDAMESTMTSDVKEASSGADAELEAARAKVMEDMKAAEPAAGDVKSEAAAGMNTDLKTLEKEAVEGAKAVESEAEAAGEMFNKSTH